MPPRHLTGEVRLHVADLDNNGAIDLVLSPTAPAAARHARGAMIWLGDDKGSFTPLTASSADRRGCSTLPTWAMTAISIFSACPRTGNAMQGDQSRAPKNYHWQVVRPHAAQAVGDQRINPFGVGGELEIRSGLLVQKQPITGPQLHFGLGDQTATDVVRVLWPNGTVRAEFEVKADQDIVHRAAPQGILPLPLRLQRQAVDFVKDAVPWGSAIGLRINTLGTASVAATEEWYKIRMRPTRAPRRLLRSADHGRAMGGLLLRSPGADDRRSSGRDRDLRRRALRDPAGEARHHLRRDRRTRSPAP